MKFNDNEFENDRTTTIEIKDRNDKSGRSRRSEKSKAECRRSVVEEEFFAAEDGPENVLDDGAPFLFLGIP